MKKYLALLIASILPLSLFSWFAPTPAGQLDFLGLWLLAMVLVALPMMYTEVALAYRSGMSPMIGLQKLTREADASTMWRSFSWLSMLLIILVAGFLIGQSAQTLMPSIMEMGVDVPNFAVTVALIVLATIISVWGMPIGVLGLLLILAGTGLAVTDVSLDLQMTAVSMDEWGRAVMMALISVGAGTGIYWHVTTNSLAPEELATQPNKKIATKAVLPVWTVQILVGSAYLVVLSMKKTVSMPASIATAIGFIFLSAVLLNFVSQSLINRFGTGVMAKIKGLLITLVLASILVLIPNHLKQIAIVILTSLSVAMLSIFTGWKMKISHLRKAMNFSSELTYNLWRVTVRLVVPISLIIGMVGWIMNWTS